jgi:peptidoglycan hydrolase CwlO-like protein
MSDEKKKYVFYGIIGLIIVSILACLFLCGGISDNGAGIESVREQLNSAATTERELTEGIESAEARTENIQERVSKSEAGIDAATNRAEDVERNITSSGELIKECQRILENVRARGEEKDAGN